MEQHQINVSGEWFKVGFKFGIGLLAALLLAALVVEALWLITGGWTIN